jgi:hypothetical protein
MCVVEQMYELYNSNRYQIVTKKLLNMLALLYSSPYTCYTRSVERGQNEQGNTRNRKDSSS